MLKSKLVETLFGGRMPSILSDSEEFTSRCAGLGVPALNLSDLAVLPEYCVVFSFCDDAAKLVFKKARESPVKKLIFCAVHVFDASIDSVFYTLELLLQSDIQSALQLQRKVLEKLECHKHLRVTGVDTQVEVSIFDDAKPYALIAEDVCGDFVHSVAEFFEVHYAHMNSLKPCPFHAEGVLKVAGILTVLRKSDSPCSQDLKDKLKKLTGRVAEYGAMAVVKNNKLRSFKVDNKEEIELLIAAAGPRGGQLTEFAIGVNKSLAPIVDFSVNSQMNEGVDGVHVAIGDGSTGYHIDFLSPGAAVVTTST